MLQPVTLFLRSTNQYINISKNTIDRNMLDKIIEEHLNKRNKTQTHNIIKLLAIIIFILMFLILYHIASNINDETKMLDTSDQILKFFSQKFIDYKINDKIIDFFKNTYIPKNLKILIEFIGLNVTISAIFIIIISSIFKDYFDIGFLTSISINIILLTFILNKYYKSIESNQTLLKYLNSAFLKLIIEKLDNSVLLRAILLFIMISMTILVYKLIFYILYHTFILCLIILFCYLCWFIISH